MDMPRICCHSVDIDSILNIHKYYMVKNNIKQLSGLLNKSLLHD